MKHVFLIYICYCVCSNTAISQRYFDSSTFYYYVTEDTIEYPSTETLPVTSRIFPIWSTHATHQNSIHTYELFKYINFESPADSTMNCWLQNLPGKLGPRVIETPNTILLFNKWNQPITIELNNIDSSWIAYENDSIVMRMFRIADETRVIFDHSYTVNRFSFDAFFKDSIRNDKNVFHHNIFEIAEGLGIVSSPMLDNFPFQKTYGNLKLLGLIDVSKQLHLGQTVLSKQENLYAAGDQFDTYEAVGGRGSKVYNSGYSDETWIRNIVTEKIIQANTVFYSYTTESINHKTYREFDNPSANYDSLYRYPIKEQQLKLAITFPSINEITDANTRTIYEDDTRGAYLYHAAFPYNKKLNVVGDFYINNTMYHNDSLWCLGFTDESLRYKKFFGIGIPQHLSYYSSGGSGYGKSYLLYAKKNGQTWGTPFPANVGLHEINGSRNAIRVYPNPVNDVVNISSLSGSEEISTLSLYDIMGRIVVYLSPKSSSVSINADALPSGIYSGVITLSDGRSISSKIIIRHE